MNRTSRAPIAAIAALALGLAVSACGASNEIRTGTGSGSSDLSGKLDGAGSSAQESAMDAWRAGFQKENSGATVNYDPSGSGAGVEKFNAGGVDFAGSDSALDAEKGEVDAAKKRCGGDAIEVPNYVSPIAVVFNVEGVDELQLSPKTIAAIFDGKITDVGRRGHQGRQPRRQAAFDHDRPGAPLRRVGHHQELHRLPREGRRGCLDAPGRQGVADQVR